MSIQFRRGTSTQRTSDEETGNGILKNGQPFYETDTGKLYIGNDNDKLRDLKNNFAMLNSTNTFTAAQYIDNGSYTKTLILKPDSSSMEIVDYANNGDIIISAEDSKIDINGQTQITNKNIIMNDGDNNQILNIEPSNTLIELGNVSTSSGGLILDNKGFKACNNLSNYINYGPNYISRGLLTDGSLTTYYYYLPSKSGTMALQSDLTNITNNSLTTSSLTTTATYMTARSQKYQLYFPEKTGQLALLGDITTYYSHNLLLEWGSNTICMDITSTRSTSYTAASLYAIINSRGRVPVGGSITVNTTKYTPLYIEPNSLNSIKIYYTNSSYIICYLDVCVSEGIFEDKVLSTNTNPTGTSTTLSTYSSGWIVATTSSIAQKDATSGSTYYVASNSFDLADVVSDEIISIVSASSISADSVTVSGTKITSTYRGSKASTNVKWQVTVKYIAKA